MAAEFVTTTSAASAGAVTVTDSRRISRERRYGKKLIVPLRWPVAMHIIDVCLQELNTTCRLERFQAAERDYVALHLGLYLGFRISEICSITVADFDFVERQARVNCGKGGRDRVVPIAAAAVDVLEEWATIRTEAGGGLYLPGPHGQFSPRCLYDRINRAGRRAGVPWLHPHTLRHAAALRLLMTGSDLRKIQKFLGHEDIRVTMRYLDVMPIDLRDDADKM